MFSSKDMEKENPHYFQATDKMLLKLLVPLTVSIFFSFSVQKHATRASMAKPGCQDKCGNLTIPYPFGIGTGCYHDESFEVLCAGSPHDQAPLRFVNHHKFPILEISMDSVRVIGKSPLTSNHSVQWRNEIFHLDKHFSYSHDRNKYVVVGCDCYALFLVSEISSSKSLCASTCAATTGISLGPNISACNGLNGCCQANIPKDIQWFHVLNPATLECSHVFVAEKNALFKLGPEWVSFHMVLNWAVTTHSTCYEAHLSGNSSCGPNSRCFDSNIGLGYKCLCLEGYIGNPYLPAGCQDVEECEEQSNNPCRNGELCENTSGSYLCTLANHHTSSTANTAAYVIGLVLFIGSLGFWASCKIKRRNRNKIKEKFFKRNGGILLMRQIPVNKSSAMNIKLYTAEEMKKATGNFSKSRFLGQGGQGTVYKGILQDGSIVAIKKSNVVDEDQVERFVNEVFILAQINHRNIVKLLGCCLEHEVPLLVYEYVSNGNLSQHLHDTSKIPTFCWKDRMRIAAEVAGALAYLHSYASPAIFHRDIKPGNILLDENLRAVVSDFGLSRSVPLSRTHLTTLIEGTFGYLDPEYFRSGKLTEKSDVYAFGVVLTELLTGRKAVSSISSDEGLASRFQNSMKHDSLFEILDAVVAMEAHAEDHLMVAKIAERCLKTYPKKRTSMKEVVADLDRLRIVQLELLDIENGRR